MESRRETLAEAWLCSKATQLHLNSDHQSLKPKACVPRFKDCHSIGRKGRQNIVCLLYERHSITEEEGALETGSRSRLASSDNQAAGDQASDEMAKTKFTEVAICRSDGTATINHNGQLISNEPSRQDSTPGPDGWQNYYHKVPLDDPISVDWRRKLGFMFMDLLGEPGIARKKNFIFKDFPTDYTLWQHRRSGPGKPRGDQYLFGYPNGGKVQRFRSPQDFFPHLLWLATDPEGDAYSNCSCKLCFAESRNLTEEPEESRDSAMEGVESSASSLAGISSVIASNSNAKVAASSSKMRSSKTAEQALDSEANGQYLYRVGELVWFNKGAAWGLAVITKRQISNSKPRYLLQPLSHPLQHLQPQIRSHEAMRPWLAWSVPSPTHKALEHLTFEQVPWEDVVAGLYGEGDTEVDGSILAAKAINASYSFFGRLDTLIAAEGEVRYRGMFLGGEKIWIGEPVRLRGSSKDDIVIMVIEQMIERIVGGQSTVTFVGDVYKFVDMPNTYKDRKDWPTPDLPARVVADLRYRNEVADNARRGIYYEWRLLEPMAKKGITDIKGRWYETRYLLPVLRGPDYDLEVQQGNASDAGLWMNARSDILGEGRPGQRKKNRLATLGAAVPADLKISRGLDGPVEDNAFPDE